MPLRHCPCGWPTSGPGDECVACWQRRGLNERRASIVTAIRNGGESNNRRLVKTDVGRTISDDLGVCEWPDIGKTIRVKFPRGAELLANG